ncbi:hypothetical protein D3C75_903870 [compost metagenome]
MRHLTAGHSTLENRLGCLHGLLVFVPLRQKFDQTVLLTGLTIAHLIPFHGLYNIQLGFRSIQFSEIGE